VIKIEEIIEELENICIGNNLVLELLGTLKNKSANLIHVDEIYFCPECGDSGMTRKVTCPECGSLFGHKPTCHGKGIDYHDHSEPCPCRKIPFSLWSIKERVKGK
jgi:hypothetical protein